ncbi:T9SS type A sorting domain-containing protein [Flavobacterium sp. XGLA_31]|uniref:T9SS type A sorting domain-containing protein n=1 Tax=Flavobacterium sp. XGLA_31 TaxID=3447666 RepID=UPI003F310B01
MKKNYLHSENTLSLNLLLIQKPLFLVVLLVLLTGTSLDAQTSGPFNATTATNLSGTGTVAWTNSGNIIAADGVSATAVFSGSSNSNYLQGTNYGFSIPTGVVVDGIEVIINRKTSAINGGRITKDNVVSIVKNGFIIGNNKATTTAWPTTLATATYGSSTDKWGTTWTAADINAGNFGVAVSVNANNSLTASVDYIQIKVYYTPAPIISGFTPTNGCTGAATSVVISGNYFTNVSAVTFNGLAAAFTVNNSTQITATLPSAASTGPITITTPSGNTASVGVFTVNPLPFVDAISGSTTICIGATTALTDTTTGGIWSSSAPGIATVNTDGVVSGLSAGSSIITYTYTNSNGCSNSTSTTVIVNALPTITAPDSICLGNTIQLTPPLGGSWISNDTTIATVSNDGWATAMALGTVTFTFTDNATSCSVTTNMVTVPDSPVIISQPTTNQNICENNSVSLSVMASGSSLNYQWYKGATPLSNGINISGATTANLTINPASQADTGTDYHCVISNGCSGTAVTNNASVTVNELTIGGVVSSSLPGITPVVRNITECHFATGTVYLSGQTGSVVRWEYSTNGGTTWNAIANTGTAYTYNNITVSSFFRAVIQNGSCGLAYSGVTLVDVIPNVKPSPVTATPQTICIGDSSNLYSESGFATSSYLATGGTFSNANPANWLVDSCGNCLNAGGSNTSDGPFRLSATNGGTYAGTNYTSSGKFAIASGNYNSVMQTPIFNTFGLPTATLSFNHAFNLQVGASVSVQLSLDGGATYNIILASYTGASTRTPYGPFPPESINLNAYIGQSSLRIRFVYSGTANSSWAIDNILIPESPSNLTTEWVDSFTGQIISTSATAVVTPTVTTTYAITSHLNGCTSYGPDGTTYITVTVNQRPTAAIGPSQTICNGDAATFSVTLTGVAPWSVTYSNGSTSTTVNNITTNPYVFSVSGISTNKTYTITALSDSKCTAKPQDLTGAAVVTVLNGTAGLWTGLVSTDWFDCHNWAGGLPSATVNAQIPAGAVRMPVIDPSTSSYAAAYNNIARAQDVIIANTASLSMSANSNLYVSRDWKNSGTFIPGNGTITFNGSTPNQVQSINSGIKNNETFYNLTLNNSNGAIGISLIDGFALTVANDLSLLNGDLRLVGEAQLVQNGSMANPTSGTGRILKDQQGTQSSYHYNYWSSPVTTNGVNYTVGEVLRDGTNSNSNPFGTTPINFGSGMTFADGALTSPIKISTSWIYKYTSVSTLYAGWEFVGSTGTIKPGEGFTMKGNCGTATNTTYQNYTFVGKPNNGTIPISIALNQNYLVGNPYPSALDADEFIKDNIKDGTGRAATNIFNGALYFWDHFGGTNHVLSGYVGGYATYSLMGGVVGISNDPLIDANGSMGTKVPTRYISVAQGFFIGTGAINDMTTNNPNLSTPVTGGTITFKNSQRVFKTETSNSSVFFKNGTVVNEPATDTRPKIRLKFQSPSGLFRQLLIGSDENATNSFDIGYDAPMIDANTEDMYWNISGSKFTIQAVPNFNTDAIIPIGIVTENEGLSIISVSETENIPESTQIYLHDNATGIDYNIKNNDFSAALPVGNYTDRFSLRFSEQTLGTTLSNTSNPMIYFTNSNNTLNIKRNTLTNNLKTIGLYNLLGQSVSDYAIKGSEEQIHIVLGNIASGTYIVKILCDDGSNFSQKIIKN